MKQHHYHLHRQDFRLRLLNLNLQYRHHRRLLMVRLDDLCRHYFLEVVKLVEYFLNLLYRLRMRHRLNRQDLRFVVHLVFYHHNHLLLM
tara:strand:+ start:223 stop:489 length:267 start_codon:yes stop_codon:yes gene_type:complete